MTLADSSSPRSASELRKAASRRARRALEHSSVLNHPPKHGWRLQPHCEFAAFLSHYKVEAGMEARYVHDLMQRILGVPVFLDSQNLTNLKDLFIHGLAASDTLVLLATKGVLRRPYCLLELWCAAHFHVPIVVLEVALRGIDWSEAQYTLANLYETLGMEQVSLISTELHVILEAAADGTPVPSISAFGAKIADALKVTERLAAVGGAAATAPPASAPLRRATLHPWGTDAEILGDTCDVIDLMAEALGRAPPQLAAQALILKRRPSRLLASTQRNALVQRIRSSHFLASALRKGQALWQAWRQKPAAPAAQPSTRAPTQPQLTLPSATPAQPAAPALISLPTDDDDDDDDAAIAIELAPSPPPGGQPSTASSTAVAASPAGHTTASAVRFAPPHLTIELGHCTDPSKASRGTEPSEVSRHRNLSIDTGAQVSSSYLVEGSPATGEATRRRVSAPLPTLMSSISRAPSPALQKMGTLKDLSAERTKGAKAAHQLMICCAREQPATVHAAQNLQERLSEVLPGSVLFDPVFVGRFAADADGTPNTPKFGETPPRRGFFSIAQTSSSSTRLSFASPRRGTSRRRNAQLLRQLSQRLRDGVGRSKAVLLLQTARAYMAPLTLLELYFAAREEKTIICLRLAGSDYDFHTATLYLQSLESNLRRDAPAHAELLDAWLDEHMITFRHLQKTLADYIPAIITKPVPFEVDGSANQVAATLSDIARLLTDVQKTPTLKEAMQERWVPGRKSRRPPSGSRNQRSQGLAMTKREAAAKIAAHYRMKKVLAAYHRLRWSALLISTVWRGHAARQYCKYLRLLRDATAIIFFHTRRWIKRRRAKRGLEYHVPELTIQQETAKRVEKHLAAKRLLSRQQTCAW